MNLDQRSRIIFLFTILHSSMFSWHWQYHIVNLTGILKWRVKFVAWLGYWAPILYVQVKRVIVRFQVMFTANKVNLWFDSWSKPNSRNWNFRKFQILCVILKGWLWKIIIRLNCRIYGKKFLFVTNFSCCIYDAKYTLSQI